MTPTFFGHNSTGTGTGGGGSAAVALSDDFNRANSNAPGGSWTEVAGDVDIDANRLYFQSSGYAANMVIHNTDVGVATQYQKFTFVLGIGLNYFRILFRCVSSTGAGYGILFNTYENEVEWKRFSNVSTGAGEQAVAGATSINIDSGDTFGVTVDGLGNNTVVRVWLNPTGLPVSASNWNGDTTPNITLTNNPTTPADTGTKLGLYCEPQFTGDAAIDNWFGGSL